MPVGPSARRFAIAFLAVCSGVALAEGQETTPTPAFGTTLHVNLVNVDVLVTDRGGVPLTDLARDEFTVFEDSHPVEITNFVPPSVPPAAPGGAASAGQPPMSPALSLVVVLDDEHLSVRTRKALASRFRDGLAPLLAGGRARAMLLGWGSSIRVRQPFTTDPDAFMTALAAAQSGVGTASGAAFEETVIARTIDARTSFSQGRGGTTDLSRDDAEALLQETRSAAQASSERARASLLAVSSFVDSLAGVPGRKVMLVLSEGMEMRPGESLLQRWQARFGFSSGAPSFSPDLEAERLSVEPQLQDLVARANASGIVIYTVDASQSAGASERAADQVGGPVSGAIAADRRASARFALQLIADGTGGRSLPASADLVGNFAALADEAAQSYSLAFAAAHEPDGKRHSIRVEVKRPGVRVRQRESYLDRTADQRAAASNLAAILHGVAGNPLGVRLGGGTQIPQADGTVVVPVLVDVPIGTLTLVPDGDLHVARLSVWLASRDADNRIHQTPKQSYAIRVENQRLLAALGQSATASFQLVMRPGHRLVVATLRDELGGGESTASVELDVDATPPAPGRPE